ncbi:hypothetical protein Ancab_036269 [Ancistrocladus abbreviatus]
MKPKLSMFLLHGLFLVFSASLFQGSFSAAQKLQSKDSNNRKKQMAGHTAVFRVGGRVYPDGYFYTTVNIGQPPRPYDLDIDSGSDLTWIQCDAPCVNCLKGPHDPYKPHNNIVKCEDPLCGFVPHPPNYPCHNPTDQCDYEIEYADNGLSLGVLVKDNFPIQIMNGSVFNPSVTFGCGYDQDIHSSSHPPFVDGVLGLANGKPSILSQLHAMGIMRNVVGHCFSHKGGGYLFFGDDLLPASGIAWVPMLQNSLEKHYSLGRAKLLLAGQNVVKGDLSLVFDSGSTYTYLNNQAYKATISMIKKNIDSKQLKDAPEDKTLPVCWKSVVPFKSIVDAKKFFKPLALSFSIAKNVILEMPPEAYLIISKLSNVCLGILDSSETKLGNLNVLGDISLLDKMVIYDNERQQIGWVSANCDRLPNMERNHNEADNSINSRDFFDEL